MRACTTGLAAAAALLLSACESDTRIAIPTTTIRVDRATNKGKVEGAKLAVFTDDSKCESDTIAEAEREACRPYVDRASGTVHLAYQLQVESNPVPMTLSAESVELLHDRHPIDTQAGDGKVDIIPHGASSVGQVYVLLIDGSGSMSEVDDGPGSPSRMDKLRRALLRPDVVEAFFASDQNVVVPLVFSSGLPAPLGGRWLVEDPDTYRSLIGEQLQVGAGYTHLYEAVSYASRGLSERPEVKAALRAKGTTIIALTDGFNNQDPRETCGANQPRLESLVTGLREVRAGKGNPGYQPDVYTVGLGQRAWRRFKLPERWEKVDERRLCPGGFEGQVVNGFVEKKGVDNAALEWIAKAGSGKSFVSRDTDGLAEAFKAAAQKRYEWFEIRYRVDPHYLRRGFDTTIRINNPYEAEATVPIYPNAWMDGPPGVVGADGWPSRPSFRASLVVVVGILSLLIAWNYLPAAGYNVRRALFGLVDAGRRTKKTG